MYLYREYDDKNFYVYLKKANKMYLVAMILSIISFIDNFIFFILDCMDITNTFANWDILTYNFYICFGLFIPISSYFGSRNVEKVKYNSKIMKKHNNESKFYNDLCTLQLYIILNYLPLVFFLYFLILSFFYSSQETIAYAEMFGRIFLQYIFMIIAGVYLIKCYKIVKKDYFENPPEYLKGKIEVKRLKQQAKNDNVVLQNYRSLIDVAGKKFFLKYYYVIRDLSFADAMDSIDDKYSYVDKEKRVQAVKKIFSLNLQKFALEKIIQEATGEINAEIKAEAEVIYKKEFPEIITDTVAESATEEAADNKPKEIT